MERTSYKPLTTNPFMDNGNGDGNVNANANGQPAAASNAVEPKLELPPHPHMLPGAPQMKLESTKIEGATASEVVRAGESVPASVSSVATRSQSAISHLENGQRLPTVTNINAGISQESSAVVGASNSCTPSSSV